MAIDTFYAERLKVQAAGGSVAVDAICGEMRSQQGKPAHLMDLIDVVHDPGARVMAVSTLQTRRLLMHIGMAANARGISLFKHERRMAASTVGIGMLAIEYKSGSDMVKWIAA